MTIRFTSSQPCHIANPGLFSRFRSFASSLRTSLRNRNELSMLAEMTDHQLADIGLTRDDVKSALSAPLGCDPAHTLIQARRNNIHRSG
ncbi:MAG: DUF1127 domain-containing protein [Anderseniella sp.]|nr:DUF1127 domain-containing protein [Anderseniella sp.]